MSLRDFLAGFAGPTMTIGESVAAATVGASSILDNQRKPKPRLATSRHAPDRESFTAWRDHPVTQFVMAGLARNAEECREEWMRRSWTQGVADQNALTGLRERADAIMGLVEADYEAWCETLGLEPDNG
jgi:hypothetical protein